MGGGGRGGRQDRRLCVREVCERGGGVGGGLREVVCVCVGGGQVPRAIRVPEMSSIIRFHDLRFELARVT